MHPPGHHHFASISAPGLSTALVSADGTAHRGVTTAAVPPAAGKTAPSEHDELLGVRARGRSHLAAADPHRPTVIRLTILGICAMLSLAAAYIRYCPCMPWLSGARPEPRTLMAEHVVLRSEMLEGGAWRVRALDAQGERQLVWGEVLDLWRSLPDFALAFQRVLATSPHAAFHWETPPLSLATRSTALFECVTLSAPHLESVDADPRVFAAHIGGERRGSARVVAFPNLGGDSTLVSPCEDERAVKLHDLAAYAHLARFVRRGSDAQAVEFWQTVARTVDDALARQAAAKPLWVSTEGSGVAWLHVRLDPRPKYFHHKQYATAMAGII